MVSHLVQDGGTFLPLHGRTQKRSASGSQHGRTTQNTASKPTDWSVEAMLRYKRTGCPTTLGLLIEYYMEGFVKKLSRKVASSLPSCIDPDDLTQVAYFGLISSIDKYDPTLNTRFEGYSRRRIVGSMRDYLRKEDHVPRLARKRSKDIAKSIDVFKAQNGRPPTDDELQTALGLTREEFLTVMRDAHAPCTVSFQPSDGDSGEDGMASIHIELHNAGIAKVDRDDLHGWIYEQLSLYDRLIVTLYYTENLSMLEVGCVVGFSESRVSQRLKHIHAILKARITDHPEIMELMAS